MAEERKYFVQNISKEGLLLQGSSIGSSIDMEVLIPPHAAHASVKNNGRLNEGDLVLYDEKMRTIDSYILPIPELERLERMMVVSGAFVERKHPLY
ncbi:hypothetical protein ACFLZX_00180 [Nanoarchaeota archaeon]